MENDMTLIQPLFHQTIEKARKEFDKGNFKKGVQILNEHLSEQHSFESLINFLMRQVAIYQQNISHACSIGGSFTDRDAFEANKQDVENMLDDAEKALWNIRKAIKQLSEKELRLE